MNRLAIGISFGALALTLGACGDNINVPPESPDVTLTTNEDTPLRLEVELVDANGDEVTFNLTSAPENGTVDVQEPIYTPNADFNGTDSVGYTVSDGFDVGTGTITIIVEPVNDAPTISAVADLSTPVDTPVVVPFGVEDIDTPLSDVRTEATSDDQAVVPNANLVLGGSGDNRDVTITPLAAGTVTITLFALDGDDVANQSFVLTVTAVPN